MLRPVRVYKDFAGAPSRGVGSGRLVRTLLPPEPVHLDHVAAAAHLGYRLTSGGEFRVL